jgi:hypothetical protein
MRPALQPSRPDPGRTVTDSNGGSCPSPDVRVMRRRGVSAQGPPSELGRYESGGEREREGEGERGREREREGERERGVGRGAYRDGVRLAAPQAAAQAAEAACPPPPRGVLVIRSRDRPTPSHGSRRRPGASNLKAAALPVRVTRTTRCPSHAQPPPSKSCPSGPKPCLAIRVARSQPRRSAALGDAVRAELERAPQI